MAESWTGVPDFYSRESKTERTSQSCHVSFLETLASLIELL